MDCVIVCLCEYWVSVCYYGVYVCGIYVKFVFEGQFVVCIQYGEEFIQSESGL